MEDKSHEVSIVDDKLSVADAYRRLGRMNRCLSCYWLNRDHYFCQQGKQQEYCGEYLHSDNQGRFKSVGEDDV